MTVQKLNLDPTRTQLTSNLGRQLLTLKAPGSQSQRYAYRVRVFIDYWNFALSIRRMDNSFAINWETAGPVLAAEAANLVNAGAPYVFEGVHIYGSYPPGNHSHVLKERFAKLDKLPGAHVSVTQRHKKKGYPKCPGCQTEAKACASCSKDLRGTEEKGVDTRMVTDMISFAWQDAYDIGVLVSSDRDFVPAAEFLQTKGLKIVHGAFPPLGSVLSQKCWGNISIPAIRAKLAR